MRKDHLEDLKALEADLDVAARSIRRETSTLRRRHRDLTDPEIALPAGPEAQALAAAIGARLDTLDSALSPDEPAETTGVGTPDPEVGPVTPAAEGDEKTPRKPLVGS